MVSWFQPDNFTLTRFLFFTGKGGVGKTSSACATALTLADQGKKVLIVSTDPASNLQDVFNLALTNQATSIPDVLNLDAMNIDPEQAAATYRETMVQPYRGTLPDSVVADMEEQLSGACTVEIAAFDEFTNLLANPEMTNTYDHIIFDTAPTGHTLRLLQLPTSWSGFLEESTHGASCLGPLSGLDHKKETYAQAVDILADGTQTTLALVARPDTSSLEECVRASEELLDVGMANQMLLINGVLKHYVPEDEVSHAFHQRQDQALQSMPEAIRQMPTYHLPYVSYNLSGIRPLRTWFQGQEYPENNQEHGHIDMPGVKTLLHDLSQKDHGVVFTMGKGGVGKTTVASTIAVGLAEQGHEVHLTTTDPAAHVSNVLANDAISDRLTVSRIDPKAEVEAYREEVMQEVGSTLDDNGLAYLEEDLNSPCTEEIAVFRAFAKVVDESQDKFVVIDTAPTGHTLLLLDAAQSYHKEIARTTGQVPASVQRLLPRLRDPEETSVVLVTLPEATPVWEAKRLQDDLQRADVSSKWWIINQSLAATTTQDPVLMGRAKSEQPWIKEVQSQLAERCAVISWKTEDLVGYQPLESLLTE